MDSNVILLLVVVATIGGSATLALTPLVRHLARKLHLIDYPDSFHKLHRHPVPLGGGVVVLVGTATATLLALVAPHPWQGLLWEGGHHLIGLFLAAVLVNLLGLADDCLRLGAGRKLAGQILIALVIVVAGLEIRRVQLLDWQVELGLLSIPFTLFWILGATNALNLLDGSDGVATTVGIVLALALAAMALMLPNRQIEAVVALALAGSLIGFLVYNFPPASIYLGDAGSMLIGLVIGVLALRSGLKGPATIALAAPAAICAIPILDTAMAIIRRKLTGRSVYATDRGHLHHCLLRHGLSSRATVLSIAALCTCTAAAALASVYRRNELLALVGILAVVGTLVVTRYFGHEESRILTTRLASAIRSLFAGRQRAADQIREEHIHVEGNRRWDTFWKALVELANRFDVSTIRLHVHLPSLHEEFHALRQQSAKADHDNHWSMDLPLVAHGQCLGRLQLRGSHTGGNSRGLSEFLSMLDQLLSSLALDGPAPSGPSEADHSAAEPSCLVLRQPVAPTSAFVHETPLSEPLELEAR